ncbi:hypothetical protein JKP88DRAFT_349220 [Tribonema minus]|uniref:Uncharacterized protein n=1 Tax=Tribonema minus TaxID=303371 RepID=A0A835YUE7_9STRA|nr:hypothetical protein JKP88DRAFT_349220 [Tribonema minus]
MAYEVGGRMSKSSLTTADVHAVREEALATGSASVESDALKLMELLVEIEKALSAAEIVECAAADLANPDTAADYAAQAGYVPLPAVPPPPPPPAATEAAEQQTVADASSDAAQAAMQQGDKDNAGDATAGPDSKGGAFTAADAAALAQLPPVPPVTIPVPAGGDTGSSSSSSGAVHCRLLYNAQGKRVVAALADDLGGGALLRALSAAPIALPLAARGLLHETLHTAPAVWAAAHALLAAIAPAVLNFLRSPAGAGATVLFVGHSFAGAVAAVAAGLLDGALAVEGGGGSSGGGSGGSGRRSEGKVGSAEARCKGGSSRRAKGVAEGGDGGMAESASAAASGGYVGAARGRVKCVTFGCPPCVSGAAALPCVTSFVLGDDMVPRVSAQSLEQLKRRLRQVLPRGSGFFGQSLAMGTTLFTDVAGVAAQGLRQRSAAGGDDSALIVPGTVWFVKPRRLRAGATMTKSRSGALRDDVLWQMHDVMLTKSMLSHHSLARYVAVLDRV